MASDRLVDRRRWTPSASMLAIVLLATLFAGGCRKDAAPPPEKSTVPSRPIEAVLQQYTPELMALPGVVGTFQGVLDDGRPFIGVMVVKRTPELERKIPSELEGYFVRIDETGVIRPLDDRH